MSPTTEYSPEENEDLSADIIAALSEAKDRDITEDECVLYQSIDPDALNKMFREEGNKDTVKVEFTTHDAIVILWGDGSMTIEIQDLEADPHYG
jgi:hypothetical protein